MAGFNIKHWFADGAFRTIIRNSAWLGSSNVVSALLGLLALSCAGKGMTPAMFGVLVIVQSYAKSISDFIKFQTWQLVVQYGTPALTNNNPQQFRNVVSFSFSLDIVSGAVAIVGGIAFLIFIFASYSAQRYLTEAANGTLALDVVLDIVFYKVLIALEMLLPVGLYVSVGVTLGQMYTDSEITAISAAGGSPGRLYKAVLYLAIPLSIFVTLLSMYGRPWAYTQIYQLEQQSQSELDVRQLRAKKFNTNDNGRMILSQTVDQDNNRLTDALIYTSTANRTRIFRARSVDVVDPSPEKPTVMLHNGTAYLLDHQGRDDNEQIYRNLQLHLNPLDQSPNVKRKAKSVTELARSAFPADHAELQWRQSRGLTALLMALLAISLSRVKPRQGRFSTLLPLTLLFIAIFYGGDVCRTLVANGAIPLIPGLWLVPGLMLMGLLMLVARDFSLLQKFSR